MLTLIEEYQQEARDILKCLSICLDDKYKDKLESIGLGRSGSNIYSTLEGESAAKYIFAIYNRNNNSSFDYLIKNNTFDINYIEDSDICTISYRNSINDKKIQELINTEESYTEEQIFQAALSDDYIKYKSIIIYKYIKEHNTVKGGFYMYSKMFYKFRYLILGLSNEEDEDSTDNIQPY